MAVGCLGLVEAYSGSFVPHVCPTEAGRANCLWLGLMAGVCRPFGGSLPLICPTCRFKNGTEEPLRHGVGPTSTGQANAGQESGCRG